MSLSAASFDTPVAPMLQRTVVVGAGPVGALAALYAARRGDLVEVYELRADLRDPKSVPLNFTRSINLALSERGINSIREARCPGLGKAVLNDAIPMSGRMIHGQKSGQLFEHAQAYDVHNHAIHAVDRGELNHKLLDELERMPNVKLKFGHKLTGADFKRNLAWFEDQTGVSANAKPKGPSSAARAKEIEVNFDFMIGADGAHSATRFHMMKFARVSYQQEYIETLWCEFRIPPADGSETYPTYDGFRLSPNHLHIWPAGSMMFIAIPSVDKSFTCTLFMAASEFEHINHNIEVLIPFFVSAFPGVVNRLIRASDLVDQYKKNPHLPLISIKCEPYHYGSSVVILGDAAHAMVPFYGQGMNAGLEDVRVLYDIIDKFCPPLHKSRHSFTEEGRKENRGLALHEYSCLRRRDAHTINELAMGNYQEMRSDVTSRLYLLRKSIEERLSLWFPASGFRTQYSRISFSNERYSDVIRNVRWQHAVLNVAGSLSLLVIASSTVSLLISRLKR